MSAGLGRTGVDRGCVEGAIRLWWVACRRGQSMWWTESSNMCDRLVCFQRDQSGRAWGRPIRSGTACTV